MPAAELPVNLRAMLDTLMEQNSLTSWQIFGNKSNVTIKINFKQQDGSQNNSDFVSYAKKPPSKISRDKRKISDFNTKRVTRSQKKEINNMDEPENMRNYVAPQSEVCGFSDCISPVIVDKSHTDLNSTPASIHVSPVNRSHASVTAHVDTPDVSRLQLSSNKSPGGSDHSDIDFDSDIGEADPTLPNVNCVDVRCTYGGGCYASVTKDAMYRCQVPACNEGGYVTDVCASCKKRGGHIGHSKYLKKLDNT